jgi:hypothetical protein
LPIHPYVSVNSCVRAGKSLSAPLGGVRSFKGDGALKVDGGDERRERGRRLISPGPILGISPARVTLPSKLRVLTWGFPPCHLGRATRATRRGVRVGRVQAGTIVAMTTANVRAHEESLVRELWGQGLSIRQIAKQAGFSRPKVDRILARIPRPFGADDTGLSITKDDDDELDDDYGDGGGYDDYEPVPPFRFVGLAVVEDRRGNPLKDSNGRPFGRRPSATSGRGMAC